MPMNIQQNQLRSDKKAWNKTFKEFRRRLQALSKGLNGRGDLLYGLPPSDIKEPLPEEVGPFINDLLSRFQQLVESALYIKEQQDNYSQNRSLSPSEDRKKNLYPKLGSLQSQVVIGNKSFPTLLAVTEEEQSLGLMFKEWPPPVMSFVYSEPKVNRFWMKSTPSPLDIVFSLQGKVTAIHKGEPFSTKLIGDYSESDLVVELPHGTCEASGISIGNSIFLKNY